jgi:glycine dehydrogenase
MSGKGDESRLAMGRADKLDNPLKQAPHTAAEVCADAWTHAYPRSQAGWPTAFQHLTKLWPYVGRVDNVWGDRNLVTSLSGLGGTEA